MPPCEMLMAVSWLSPPRAQNLVGVERGWWPGSGPWWVSLGPMGRAWGWTGAVAAATLMGSSGVACWGGAGIMTGLTQSPDFPAWGVGLALLQKGEPWRLAAARWAPPTCPLPSLGGGSLPGAIPVPCVRPAPLPFPTQQHVCMWVPCGPTADSLRARVVRTGTSVLCAAGWPRAAAAGGLPESWKQAVAQGHSASQSSLGKGALASSCKEESRRRCSF